MCLLILSGCAQNGAGKLRIDPAPANATAPCKRPEVYLGANDWEIIASRIGDELVDCGQKHSILVARDLYITDALQGRDYWEIAP